MSERFYPDIFYTWLDARVKDVLKCRSAAGLHIPEDPITAQFIFPGIDSHSDLGPGRMGWADKAGTVCYLRDDAWIGLDRLSEKFSERLGKSQTEVRTVLANYESQIMHIVNKIALLFCDPGDSTSVKQHKVEQALMGCGEPIKFNDLDMEGWDKVSSGLQRAYLDKELSPESWDMWKREVECISGDCDGVREFRKLVALRYMNADIERTLRHEISHLSTYSSNLYARYAELDWSPKIDESDFPVMEKMAFNEAIAFVEENCGDLLTNDQLCTYYWIFRNNYLARYAPGDDITDADDELRSRIIDHGSLCYALVLDAAAHAMRVDPSRIRTGLNKETLKELIATCKPGLEETRANEFQTFVWLQDL